MTIAFIGLGNMGFPMAKNLLASGFTVRAYNRSPEKGTPLQEAGAWIATTIQDAVHNADVVITMLSDDTAINEISHKMLPAMKKGAIHLSMSTISPATSVSLHALHKQHHIEYLAAPVMGRPPAAEARQLYILLSGNSEAKETVNPVLQALSQLVFDYGENISAGNTVKLMVNYMIFVVTEMLSEIMLVAENADIDKTKFLDTMTSTIFGAPVIKSMGILLPGKKIIQTGSLLSWQAKICGLCRIPLQTCQ